MVLLMAPDWKREAAVMMRRAWMKNEIASVPRRRGWRRRQSRAKKKAPKVKHITEVRDLTQPYGLVLDFGLEEAPRPTKMVFPLARDQ